MKKDFKALIESAKYTPLEESQANTLAAIMETTAQETERQIAEGTIAGDIAQFTPFLMPMLRKVYPALIANELLGMQPLSGPTGFIYSLTNRNIGDAATAVTKNAKTQIVKLAEPFTGVTPVIGNGVVLSTGLITNAAAQAGEARIVYIETSPHNGPSYQDPSSGVVVNSGAVSLLVELPDAMNYGIGGLTVVGDIAATFTGLAAWDKILPNYTGSYTTANGETRGVVGNEMAEVAISVERTQVEAKARKIRAEYTIEMYQDLKAMHGVLADQELMNLMGYEIKAETDREVVDFVNGKAGSEGDFYMSGGYGAAGTTAALNAGRWEIERYRSLGIKIADVSREIGRLNKRGAANKLLVSPKVLTALEAIGGFSTAPVDSTVNAQSLNPIAGRFDNKYNVVVDNYAETDYVTALYKGSNQDSLGVYAPYTPVQIQKVNHVTTGQPALIAMSRYGLCETPWGGFNYATQMGVNFNSTVLG